MDTPMNRIMLLHKTIGNQAMQRLIKSRALQAKHRIGQPEQEDFYRARSLIREADRNTRELFRSYNLDARDLPHIQSYLNRTYSLMSDFRSMGIRPVVYLRLALIEAQSIPSRDDAR